MFRQILPFDRGACRFLITDYFTIQNEYAAILSKRVNEEKAKRSETRKRRASSMKK